MHAFGHLESAVNGRTRTRSNPHRRSIGYLMAVAAVAWCASSASGALPPIREGGTLRVNDSADFNATIDPGVNYNNSGWAVFYATCAKLVNYPDANLPGSPAVVPEVATTLPTVSDSGRQYTFTIRPGFRFNTGEAVTAASFAAAINRDLAPQLHSAAVAFLQDVVGAEQVIAGKATTASGVVASGDTLTLQLTAPAPDFVTRLAMPFFCAVPAALPPFDQGYNPVPMAGPYYIASETPHEIILKPNPYYAGSRSRHLAEIDVNQGTDPLASMLAIGRGSADYDIGNLDTTLLRSYKAEGKLGTAQFSVHPDLELRYLIFNLRRPVFRDVRLRQAVNFALDRRHILAVSGLYGKPTGQILPPAMPGYRKVAIYPLDGPNLAAARRLVAGRHLVANLYVSPDQISSLIATEVADDLQRIGITVNIDNLTDSATVHTAPWDLVINGWIADYPDPYDFINAMLFGATSNTSGSENLGAFRNHAFDVRMAAAASLSGTARWAAYARLDADLMRTAAPIAPIADVYEPQLLSHRVRVDCQSYPTEVAGLDLATTCLR